MRSFTSLLLVALIGVAAADKSAGLGEHLGRIFLGLKEHGTLEAETVFRPTVLHPTVRDVVSASTIQPVKKLDVVSASTIQPVKKLNDSVVVSNNLAPVAGKGKPSVVASNSAVVEEESDFEVGPKIAVPKGLREYMLGLTAEDLKAPESPRMIVNKGKKAATKKDSVVASKASAGSAKVVDKEEMAERIANFVHSQGSAAALRGSVKKAVVASKASAIASKDSVVASKISEVVAKEPKKSAVVASMKSAKAKKISSEEAESYMAKALKAFKAESEPELPKGDSIVVAEKI